MIRVIIAGEGKNELGGFAIDVAFRDEVPEPGVLEALLEKVCPDGFRVVDAILWKKTPKLQVGIGGKGEELNVLRAHHHAKKRGCDVLVFTRDRDKAKFAHRKTDIERAIETLANESPAIVGGVAIEKLESWLTAIAGVRGSEDLRRPEEKLLELGVDEKNTRAMVRLIEEAGLDRIPADAHSLRQWLARAREALKHPQ